MITFVQFRTSCIQGTISISYIEYRCFIIVISRALAGLFELIDVYTMARFITAGGFQS